MSTANLLDIEYLAIKLSLQALGLDVVVPLSFGFLMAGLSGAIQHTSPLFLVNTVPAQGHRKRISNT